MLKIKYDSLLLLRGTDAPSSPDDGGGGDIRGRDSPVALLNNIRPYFCCDPRSVIPFLVRLTGTRVGVVEALPVDRGDCGRRSFIVVLAGDGRVFTQPFPLCTVGSRAAGGC